jgi:hypothetical protein
MALQKQTAQFPLAGGQNNRAAPQLLQAPEVVQALNLYRARSGEWTKRNAFHYLPQDYLGQDGFGAFNTIGKTRAMGGQGSNLVAVGSKQWFVWSALRQSLIDMSIPVYDQLDQRMVTHRMTRVPFVQDAGATATAESCDVAYGNGKACVVWNQGFRTYMTLLEEATGQIVASPLDMTGLFPRVVHAQNRFLVVTVQFSGSAAPSTLLCTTYNSVTGQLIGSTGVTVAADAIGSTTGTPYFDIQARSNGNVLVGYRATGPNVRALEWNPLTGAVSIASTVVVAGDQAGEAIGWVLNAADAGVDPRLATVVNTATGVVVRRLNPTTLAQTAAVTVLASPGDVQAVTGVLDTASGDVQLLWTLRPADVTLSSIVEGHTVPVSTKPFMGIGCLVSKPFRVNAGAWYVATSMPWTLQPGYQVVPMRATGELTLGRYAPPGVVAGILRGSSESQPVHDNTLRHVPGVSTTKFLLGCLRIYDLASVVGATLVKRRPEIATLDFDGVTPRPISYGNSMMVPGSVNRHFAGDAVVEAGFLLDPEAPVATITAGGAMTPGLYRYVAVFRYVDAEGRSWRSAPSPVSATVTAAGGNLSASVVIKQIFASSVVGLLNKNLAYVELYRTTANGVNFFRLPQVGPLVMDSAAQTLTWADTRSDADLELNVPLYTDGGELFDQPPPPSISMAVVGDRIVGVDAEDRVSIFASKAMSAGRGVGFHPDLRVRIEADGEAYAVAALGQRTVVFKRQAIYLLSGDWPDNAGGGSLPRAERIAAGFGTIEQESVRESPDGIWFKDPQKGLCVLTGGGVVQAGKPLQDYEGLDVVGVETMEGEEHVLVHHSNGRIGVYNYLEKQWSDWFSIANVTTCTAMVGGVYYYGVTDGNIAFYNPASFQDSYGGTFNYTASLTTRLSLAGIEGIQRIYRLAAMGRMDEAVTLAAQLTDDFGTTVTESKSITSPFAGKDVVLPGTFSATFRPRTQRTTNLVLTLSFLSTGAGLRFTALAAEFGIRPGLRKRGAASMT